MTDSFGRAITYLRVSVTELCNLRCQYCMPAEGVRKRSHADMLTEEELLRAVRIAAQLGVTKVRVTGGEPLVKRNILSICRGIADIPGVEELCLTTNGVLLPPLADELRAAGVRRVNLSLDTLDAEKYARITRIGCLDDALRGLDAVSYTHLDVYKRQVHDLYLGEECAVGEIDEAEVLTGAQIANPAADLDGLPGKFFGFFEKGTHGDELFHIVFLAFGVYLLFI